MSRDDPEIRNLKSQIAALQERVDRLAEQPTTTRGWAAESRRKIEAGIAAAGDPDEIRRRRRNKPRKAT